MAAGASFRYSPLLLDIRIRVFTNWVINSGALKRCGNDVACFPKSRDLKK